MKAPPAPMVSGRYFFPKAPLLCLKRMPASAVTSVNSMSPEGRGGVGLGEGEAAAICSDEVLVAGATCAGCLHPASRTKRRKSNQPLFVGVALRGHPLCRTRGGHGVPPLQRMRKEIFCN